MSIPKRPKIEQSESKEITIVKDKHDDCLPIKSLDELRNWKPSMRKHTTSILEERVPSNNSPKTLLCHDMRGGYLDDRFINGSNTEDSYYFLHWYMIDIFVYFSHHFVTIPPCGWISAAHKDGVQILGTFITEWDEGIKMCDEFLRNESAVEELSTQLVKIAEYFNFDGWLINIENKLQDCQASLLRKFVEILTIKMHSHKKGSQIIWYDSVLKTGELEWQNALNEHNKPFFDCCDGIFLNYKWTEDTLQQSVNIAGERKGDVYVGIDVFGRGCPGGGGFCTNIAVTIARKFKLSVAIFAPGWIYEILDVKDFKENQFKFWNALQKLCPSRVTKSLPFTSCFCPGFGKKLFKYGQVLSKEPWFNISLQEKQPIYNLDHDSDKNKIVIYNEDAFNGGGCICLTGDHDDNKEKGTFCFKILKTSFMVTENLLVSYVFKPLIPISSIVLVLHINSPEQSYNLHLVEKKPKHGDSVCNYLLPATKNTMNEIHCPIEDNPRLIEGWIKRLYIIKHTKFENHCIENISFVITPSQNETCSVLLGELQISPLHPKINLTYRDLKFQFDNEKSITVECTLEWTSHSSIWCHDLFIVLKGEKKHLCRTSQLYYNLKFLAESANEFEIILSIQSYEHQCFPDISLKIPIILPE